MKSMKKRKWFAGAMLWLVVMVVIPAISVLNHPVFADSLIEKKITGGTEFGISVSVSGDTALVGAPAGGWNNSGSAYVFERNRGGTDNWGKVSLSSDDSALASFGGSVSVSGDIAVVGAYYEADYLGSVYVFGRNQGGTDNWGRVAKITPDDPDVSVLHYQFGDSVSVSGGTLVVGASGSVYVFGRNHGGTDNWGQIATIVAPSDKFGVSVSVSGDIAIVGASGDDDKGSNSGSVYVFGRNQGGTDNWGQIAKITPDDVNKFDSFGRSVSVSGDIAVVGANWGDGAVAYSGSVYVFGRNHGGTDNWGQVAKITPDDGAERDWFGSSVSVSGDIAVVGAYGNDDKGINSGSVYVFKHNQGGTDNWGQIAKIIPDDGAEGHQFGVSVSVSGDTAVVGANGGNSAYILHLSSVSVDAPLVSDGFVTPDITAHPLYHLTLSPENTDATLTQMTFKTNGTYKTSDIGKFQLWFSADETLDTASDTKLAEVSAVGAESSLTFSGLSKTISDGGVGHLFLTADIASGAGVWRTIYISGPSTSDMVFTESVSIEGTLGQGGVQTIKSVLTVESLLSSDGFVAPDTTSHPLYHLTLSPQDTDTTLTQIIFRTNGTYKTSDISNFRLWFSADQTLTASDTKLAELSAVATGNDLSFSGLLQSISKGSVGHLFLTADIASGAGGGRTIYISGLSTSDMDFSESVSISGTLGQGGEQTFESSKVTISAHPISGATALQSASGHGLYCIKLSVGDKQGLTLTGLTVATKGTYTESDITGFSLRFSENNILDPNDPELNKQTAVSSGSNIKFTGFSHNLPAGSQGYFFITADIDATVENGHTLSLAAIDFDNILFQPDPVKVGSLPAGGGEVHTLYAFPKIEVSTPEISEATVAQGTADHSLYKILLDVSGNSVALTGLTLSPAGSYEPSDIDGLTLFASADENLDKDDNLIAEAVSVSSGQDLVFKDFSHTINKGERIYLIAAADIGEDAKGNHYIQIEKLELENLTFDPDEAVISEKETLVTGGVQTFPTSPYIGMAAGFYHTIALKQNGTVWAWGNNENGQIGDGTNENTVIALPVLDLTGIEELAAGDFFSIALKEDGTVWAWGQNDFGQLGDGTFEDRNQPVQVSGLTNVISIAAGRAHSVALRDDGSVWTWGVNRYGQLGDGTVLDSRTPVRVSGLSDVEAIAAGGGWAMALKSDGRVWSWGQNDAGQLGDGFQTNRNTPVQISDISGIEAIAAGDYHGLALKPNTVFAWGENKEGQLGNGTNTNSLTPVQVSGLTTATSVAAGSRHSLARLSDGSVRAWGWNKYGQLGHGEDGEDTGLSGIKSVSAGGDFSLALKTDGTIQMWGHNRYGQLGDGTLDDRNTPVPGGVIPLIEITSTETQPDTAPRGADDHVLYKLRLKVTDADATLTGLTLSPDGDYEMTDIEGFSLRYSDDETLDNKDQDPELDIQGLVPPAGNLRFDGFTQPIKKGTTGYLFITLNIADDPVGQRYIFIKKTPFDQIQFAERNVFKSGDAPLPAGGMQTFPTITVNIEYPFVPSAEVQQNTEKKVIYRLDLSKTAGTEDATLTSLTLTTRGTYRVSDIVDFKLRSSKDENLDSDDPIIGIKETAVPPNTDIEFTELAQSVSDQTVHLFLTADISATAGGDRIIYIADASFSDIRFAESFVAKTGTKPAPGDDFGSALSFGGQDDYVECGKPPAEITGNKPRTIEAWAYTRGFDFGAIFHMGEPETEKGFTLRTTKVKDFWLLQFYSSSYNIDVELSDSLNQWHHYAISYDGSTIRLYYDCVEKASKNDITLNTSDTGIWVGYWLSMSRENYYFDGKIDEVRIWNTALDGSTLQNWKNREITSSHPNYGNLVAYYNFDEGSGSTASDTAGSNNGTLVGDPSWIDSGAGDGIITFPISKITATGEADVATAEQSAANHTLYRMKLEVSDADITLTKLTLTMDGDYKPSDIGKFRLYYSADDQLNTEADPVMAEHEVVSPGESLKFTDFSRTIRQGTGYMFLTADIGDFAVARNVSVKEMQLNETLFFSDAVAYEPADASISTGGKQTFPKPKVAVTLAQVPAGKPEQDTKDHPLYKFKLDVSDARAVLTRVKFTTAGNYDVSDIGRFTLRYSEDGTIDDGDISLGMHDALPPGSGIEFDNISQTIEKGASGYIILSADIAKANGARTLSITGTPVSTGLSFQESENLTLAGETTLAAGAVQTFPVSDITLDSPAVTAEEIEQDTSNLVLFRINVTPNRADTMLKEVTFTPQGTYISSDLASREPFKLLYSEDETLDPQDSVIGTESFVSPGTSLTFTELYRPIAKDTIGYLFLTADIGSANGARAINIKGPGFDQISFDYDDKVTKEGTDPMADGGVKTFPVPSITIASVGENFGSALSFDGKDDYVDCGQVPDEITGNKPRTIEAWAYTRDFNHGGIFYYGSDSSEKDFCLRTMNEKEEWRVQLYFFDYDVSLPGSLNQWHHYAMTYDGTTVRLYYDGEEKVSEDVSLDTGDSHFVIGKYSTYEFNGNIEDVRIWDTALSQSIIQSWKDRDITSSHPNYSNLVSHYKFDEGSGTSASDDKGANDGTLHGNPVWIDSSVSVRVTEVAQDTPDHILYQLKVDVTRAEAVLKSLKLTPKGTYLASDLEGFKLRYSENDTLNAGDALVGEAKFVGPDQELAFTGLSETIDKDKTGYLFVTANIGKAVGRHIFISETPFENIEFEFGEKLGENSPLSAGVRQQFPVPHIEISSPAVDPDTVEARTENLVLYRLDLNVTKVDAILKSLTLTPSGTYKSSDIQTDCPGMETCDLDMVFKLWYSEDDIFTKDDPVIKEQSVVKSGASLGFTELSQTISRDSTGHLFVTANIGPAVGDRTIHIKEVPFENIAFSYREKTGADPLAVKTGTSPLTAGGVQTIAKTPGNVLEMDGEGDYAEIPYKTELNPFKFTVSVKASVSRQQDAKGNTITMPRQTIVSSIDEDAYQGYEIFVDTDNLLKFRIGTGSGWTVFDGPEIITHRFYDITGTYNGTGAALFVNGEPFEENVSSGFSPNTSKVLRIGNQPDGDFSFNGQVEDLHIWNISREKEDIEKRDTPTDDEADIVAHYRFTPWGKTLTDTTGHNYGGTIVGDPAYASALSGLWIGQIEINEVNEVGFGFADNDTTRDVANPFDMRILLHVDGEESVSLLRHVTLMRKKYSVENDDGTKTEMARSVLVTDDDRLYEYEGVVRRDGKLVGIRLGTIFFDFDPELNELPINGKIRQGASLAGRFTQGKDHPRNPFRHLYHPDHRTGRDVTRDFTLIIDAEAELNNPKAGTLELNGVYQETVEGLHKVPIRIKGKFRLERVSTIAVLNDE